MSKLTATEKLRAMLDERGVEWEDDSPIPSMKQWKTSFTSFTGEEVTLSCYDEPKWIMGTMVFHTPEQAVAATLGPGTCHDVGRYAFVCSECGWASDEPHHILGGFWPKYCPECGRAVVE